MEGMRKHVESVALKVAGNKKSSSAGSILQY